ncbi:MAG TPA: ribbon-helix-helix protein, CopG family [Opitutaceae bacterium]|nr:ribbon-helix-helix protein, CopG family [Opitutaceae bacterium]
MAKNSSTNLPLTFDLPHNLIAKIEACRRAMALRSTSEVVREALAGFDFNGFNAPQKNHRQISVRLPLEVKDRLAKYSRKKKVSVGELLRVAIHNLPVRPAKKNGAKTGRGRVSKKR